MALSITAEQLAALEVYYNEYNYEGGWNYLASIGDNYADDAAAVTSTAPLSGNTINDMLRTLIKTYWDVTAGPGAYDQKFKDVARQHFRQYVEDIKGSDNYLLPNTDKIGKSYVKAVSENGLPSLTAIDGSFTRTVGDGLRLVFPDQTGWDWPDALGVEDERQAPSEVFKGIDRLNAIKAIGETLLRLLPSASAAEELLIGEMLKDVVKAFIENSSDFINDIEQAVSDFFTAARNWMQPRRDPLVLDLDGDGIETLAASIGVLFDHNGDGIKTGGGWVKGDDAFLVRDLNGNGSIDNGALRDSVYSALVFQARLMPLVDSIDLTLSTTGGLGFDFSAAANDRDWKRAA